MVVHLTFDTPLIFRRRRPWMEARLSLVSSLGYTFNSFNSSPTLHSFTAHTTRQQIRSSPVLSCSCSTGREGGERSIIAARPPSPCLERYPQVLLRPLHPLLSLVGCSSFFCAPQKTTQPSRLARGLLHELGRSEASRSRATRQFYTALRPFYKDRADGAFA